jgi:hypothetical protein
MDLYTRLEELRGMTHLLIDDVKLLRDKVGARKPDATEEEDANRRFYIRAVLALIEAFVEQHRRLLLDLCDIGNITLAQKTRTKLREIKEVSLADGSKEERTQYLKIFEKIKTVYKAAGHGFGQPLNVTFDDGRWDTFRDAMELRNQITHPKNIEDCWINDGQLETVGQANEWFKTLTNEFVQVAQAHREVHRW